MNLNSISIRQWRRKLFQLKKLNREGEKKFPNEMKNENQDFMKKKDENK